MASSIPISAFSTAQKSVKIAFLGKKTGISVQSWEKADKAARAQIGTLQKPKEGAEMTLISIAPGAVLEKPLSLSFSGDASMHVVIVVGEGAKGTMLEEPKGRSHTVEIFLKDEAELEYVSLQASSVPLTIHHRSQIGSHTAMQWRVVSLGGSPLEHDLISRVEGIEATSAVDWMFLACRDEKMKLNVRNIFHGANGGGEVLMKGIAEDKAQAMCRGMIEIGERGAGTNTYLTQEVLMLDKTAKVDAVPALEIKTNDVKASHSATIARVTPEDLFYFASRGIEEEAARRMFIEGFLTSVTSRIADAVVREVVERAILGKQQAKH